VNWTNTLPEVAQWQIAEFCEGRNIAVSLLFDNGNLYRTGMYERLAYFMSGSFRSGVSGNISRGKFFYDAHIEEQVRQAIEEIETTTKTKAHGFLTVDLIAPKAQNAGVKITEINVRPTAPVGMYALAGFHILGDWLRIAIGRQIGPYKAGNFSQDNQLLRDIDGIPIFLNDASANKVIDLTSIPHGF
jgi:predicted ATP-grasp superfamily ATP-dependent carboligase